MPSHKEMSYLPRKARWILKLFCCPGCRCWNWARLRVMRSTVVNWKIYSSRNSSMICLSPYMAVSTSFISRYGSKIINGERGHQISFPHPREAVHFFFLNIPLWAEHKLTCLSLAHLVHWSWLGMRKSAGKKKKIPGLCFSKVLFRKISVEDISKTANSPEISGKEIFLAASPIWNPC